MTPALESIMHALEARIPNLHPKNRERAKGIIDNVRRYGRATDPQRRELVRLEKLSKRKWRAPKPKAHIAENYRGYRDGSRYVSPAEQAANARWRAAEERAAETMSPEDYEAWKRARYDASKARMDNQVPNGERRERRYIVAHYDRGRMLGYALPNHMQPTAIRRKILIGCLLRRLAYLREKGPKSVGTYMDWRVSINRVRACLIAEGLAILRERQTIRNLQAAE